MNPSPEDIAKSGNGEQQRDWLLEPVRKPREIMRFMRAAHKDGHSAYVAESALEVRIAEIMEGYTRRLIWLTWILAFLTLLLLLFTAYPSYDAYLKDKGTETAKPHASQQAEFYGVYDA